MPRTRNLHPLSRTRHDNLHWAPPQAHWFAADRMLVPVTMAELSRVVSMFPLAFVQQAGKPILHALLGLEEGRCACVDHRGRWRAPYLPAWLRTHPFYLVRNDQEEYVVAVDENAPEARADVTTGEPVWVEDGAFSAGVENVVGTLRQMAQNSRITERAAEALADADVLVPWKPEVRVGDATRRLGGLQRVDEARLGALDPAELARLRDAGALGLAYGQLLSTEQIRVLQQQVRKRQREQEQVPPMADMLGNPAGEQQFDWDAFDAENNPASGDED